MFLFPCSIKGGKTHNIGVNIYGIIGVNDEWLVEGHEPFQGTADLVEPKGSRWFLGIQKVTTQALKKSCGTFSQTMVFGTRFCLTLVFQIPCE